MSFSVSKVLVFYWWTWNVLCWGDRLSAGFADVLRQTESLILGAVSKLDEFLLNLRIRTFSGTVPGTFRNADVENQEPSGDRSQNYPHPLSPSHQQSNWLRPGRVLSQRLNLLTSQSIAFHMQPFFIGIVFRFFDPIFNTIIQLLLRIHMVFVVVIFQVFFLNQTTSSLHFFHSSIDGFLFLGCSIGKNLSRHCFSLGKWQSKLCVERFWCRIQSFESGSFPKLPCRRLLSIAY